LALADHQKNVADCKNDMTSCDHSQLTQSEARDSSVARHQRNLVDCQDGFGDCDRSRLTQAELETVDLALRERNVSNCKDGAGACDRSKLSGSQAIEVLASEHQHDVWNWSTYWRCSTCGGEFTAE